MKTELIVKDNALINASYNLDLVEQRLILLAIVEARESGKGINANDPLTVHAESYINQFGVHGTVAKLAMRQPFVLFKGLTFQKLCLPGAFRPGDHHNKMLRPGLCVVHASPQYL